MSDVNIETNLREIKVMLTRIIDLVSGGGAPMASGPVTSTADKQGPWPRVIHRNGANVEAAEWIADDWLPGVHGVLDGGDPNTFLSEPSNAPAAGKPRRTPRGYPLVYDHNGNAAGVLFNGTFIAGGDVELDAWKARDAERTANMAGNITFAEQQRLKQEALAREREQTASKPQRPSEGDEVPITPEGQ